MKNYFKHVANNKLNSFFKPEVLTINRIVFKSRKKVKILFVWQMAKKMFDLSQFVFEWEKFKGAYDRNES